MTVRLPIVVGYGRAMEMIITGRAVDAEEALRIGLANEVVPEGKALERALELAHEVAKLPQGAIRTDKETLVRNVGRTYEEQLRQEMEQAMAMFMRRDSHAVGASAFKEGRTPSGPTTVCERSCYLAALRGRPAGVSPAPRVDWFGAPRAPRSCKRDPKEV